MVLVHVRYKVLLLVAKSQQGLAPKYLCELMSKSLYAHSSCPLLIVVIFLYHGSVLLYLRIGPLLWWVLHSGMTLLLHSRVQSVMLQGISSVSLHSLKTFIFTSLSR